MLHPEPYILQPEPCKALNNLSLKLYKALEQYTKPYKARQP